MIIRVQPTHTVDVALVDDLSESLGMRQSTSYKTWLLEPLQTSFNHDPAPEYLSAISKQTFPNPDPNPRLPASPKPSGSEIPHFTRRSKSQVMEYTPLDGDWYFLDSDQRSGLSPGQLVLEAHAGLEGRQNTTLPSALRLEVAQNRTRHREQRQNNLRLFFSPPSGGQLRVYTIYFNVIQQVTGHRLQLPNKMGVTTDYDLADYIYVNAGVHVSDALRTQQEINAMKSSGSNEVEWVQANGERAPNDRMRYNVQTRSCKLAAKFIMRESNTTVVHKLRLQIDEIMARDRGVINAHVGSRAVQN